MTDEGVFVTDGKSVHSSMKKSTVVQLDKSQVIDGTIDKEELTRQVEEWVKRIEADGWHVNQNGYTSEIINHDDIYSDVYVVRVEAVFVRDTEINNYIEPQEFRTGRGVLIRLCDERSANEIGTMMEFVISDSPNFRRSLAFLSDVDLEKLLEMVVLRVKRRKIR